MYGASNVPIAGVINNEGGLRSLDDIAAAFKAGIDPELPVIPGQGDSVRLAVPSWQRKCTSL